VELISDSTIFSYTEDLRMEADSESVSDLLTFRVSGRTYFGRALQNTVIEPEYKTSAESIIGKSKGMQDSKVGDYSVSMIWL